MKCEDCNGEVNEEIPITLKTGCSGATLAYPCSDCERLHYSYGSSVLSQGGKKVYYKNGEIFLK